MCFVFLGCPSILSALYKPSLVVSIMGVAVG